MYLTVTFFFLVELVFFWKRQLSVTCGLAFELLTAGQSGPFYRVSWCIVGQNNMALESSRVDFTCVMHKIVGNHCHTSYLIKYKWSWRFSSKEMKHCGVVFSCSFLTGIYLYYAFGVPFPPKSNLQFSIRFEVNIRLCQYSPDLMWIVRV